MTAWLDIGVSGLTEKLDWLHSAFSTGRVRLHSAVDLVFTGSPIPEVERPAEDLLVFRWRDGAWIDGPGLVNVTIDRVEAYRDRARIFLNRSPDIDIVDRRRVSAVCLTEDDVRDITAEVIANESIKTAAGLRNRVIYTTKGGVSSVVREYCRAVNEGRITQWTSVSDARRQLTGFVPAWVLWWLGREAAWMLLRLLWRRIWGGGARQSEVLRVGDGRPGGCP